jgi:hypothetical protein
MPPTVGERLTVFAKKEILRTLAAGHAIPAGLVLGWDHGAALVLLPPQKPAWSEIVLALDEALRPDALGLVMTAFVTRQANVMPRNATDRQNAGILLLVEREAPDLRQLAWGFSIDHSIPEGTPGRHFGIHTMEPPPHDAVRSPHLDTLVAAWKQARNLEA